jgi:hypothetical protein
VGAGGGLGVWEIEPRRIRLAEMLGKGSQGEVVALIFYSFPQTHICILQCTLDPLSHTLSFSLSPSLPLSLSLPLSHSLCPLLTTAARHSIFEFCTGHRRVPPVNKALESYILHPTP